MARKQVRRSAEWWRTIVVKQSSSGLSVAAFCAREGLNAPSFYQWRSRLAGAEASSEASAAAPREAFVDLGALSAGGRLELRIDLGAGVVLHLARG